LPARASLRARVRLPRARRLAPHPQRDVAHRLRALGPGPARARTLSPNAWQCGLHAAHRMTARASRLLRLTVRVAVTALLLVWLFRQAGGWGPVLSGIRAARTGFIGAAFLATLV